MYRYNTNSKTASYNNQTFRSQLESRWARFLDKVKEPWEYEPKRYHFEDGLGYSPDFWLVNLKSFLEVKGGAYTPADIQKAQNLAKESQTRVILSLNDPFSDMLEVIDPLEEDPQLMTWALDEENNLTLQPYTFSMKHPCEEWEVFEEYLHLNDLIHEDSE